MTTFGEINEPSSRTAWEDWDEGVSNENLQQLHLEKHITPEEINTLLILEGRYLSEYIKTQKELELINSITEVDLKLYRTKSMNNYVCVIKDYNLVLSSEIVELLKPYVTASKDVIGILTKSIVEYQVSELGSQDYVIRALYTTNVFIKSLDINFPKLEQPNIISGVAAGALSLREILGQSAVAIVCYIEHPEEQNIYELHRLLEKFKVVPNVDIKRNNLLSTNLYI